jgi:hypothetical protein
MLGCGVRWGRRCLLGLVAVPLVPAWLVPRLRAVRVLLGRAAALVHLGPVGLLPLVAVPAWLVPGLRAARVPLVLVPVLASVVLRSREWGALLGPRLVLWGAYLPRSAVTF